MISWSQRWLEITGWAKKQFWLKREFVHTGGSDVFRLLPITLNKDGVVDPTLLDLSDYALLPGRAGGQTLHGGVGSGETLTLRGSAHATSGGVVVDDALFSTGLEVSNPGFSPVIIERIAANVLAQAFAFRKSRGGAGVAANDQLGRMMAFGELDTGNYAAASNNQNVMMIQATEAFTATAQGRRLDFLVVQNGNVASQVALRLENDRNVIMPGRVSVGTTSDPVTSAALEIGDTTGALLLPRLTTAQRDALTAANGMVLFNTTTNKVQARAGGTWVDLH